MTRLLHFEILIDRSESPKKCTIHPLRERSDFKIVYFRRGEPLQPMGSEWLLDHEGTPLDQLPESLEAQSQAPKQGRGIWVGAIDCHWKRLNGIRRSLPDPLPKRIAIPKGFVTAYPRKNKEGLDPDGGLATIEALFIVAAFFKSWDETMLDHYHWKDSFLTLNKAVFESYGLGHNTPS